MTYTAIVLECVIVSRWSTEIKFCVLEPRVRGLDGPRQLCTTAGDISPYLCVFSLARFGVLHSRGPPWPILEALATSEWIPLVRAWLTHVASTLIPSIKLRYHYSSNITLGRVPQGTSICAMVFPSSDSARTDHYLV
jgi:hypothetical protein